MVLSAVEKLVCIIKPNLLLEVLNRSTNIGYRAAYVVYHLDSASGRVHGFVVSKMINAFFAFLPLDNLLFSSSREFADNVKQYAHHVDSEKEYFRLMLYRGAWKNACTTALVDLINDFAGWSRNIIRQMPD